MNKFSVSSNVVMGGPLNPSQRWDVPFLQFVTAFCRNEECLTLLQNCCERANSPNYFRAEIQKPLLTMGKEEAINFLKVRLHWPMAITPGTADITNEEYQERLELLRQAIVQDWLKQKEAEIATTMQIVNETKRICQLV